MFMRLQDELEVAEQLALETAKALLSFAGKQASLVPGSRNSDSVTIPDLIADDIIKSGLQRAFPHDALSSEQSPLSPDRFECNRLWLVDALDGAANFALCGDDYSVSIGLAIRGQAVLGVVYNPARDELYTGAWGEPTTCNGCRVNPTRKSTYAGARVGIPSSEVACSKVFLESHSIRSAASTSYQLARVAAGMEDGFLSVLPGREWRTCAGVALVYAAGGRAALISSHEVAYNNDNLSHPTGVIAGGRNMLALLNRAVSDAPQKHMPPAA